MTRTRSPYVADNHRLSDVIAAIQACGTYKFYKLGVRQWADRISGDEEKTEHWNAVFTEHPEFFRFDANKEKVSLVWRRQHPKRYHVDTESLISREEFYRLSPEDKLRVSRTPLSGDEITKLIESAISLHNSALESEKNSRWWLIPLISAGSALIGGLVANLKEFIELIGH